MSIPSESKALKNPLTNSDAAVAAGRELYQKNCEVCHASDGSGKTATASGLYPPPVNLSRAAVVKRKRTDGELFYLIRNTDMPATTVFRLVRKQLEKDIAATNRGKMEKQFCTDEWWRIRAGHDGHTSSADRLAFAAVP